MIWLGRIFWLAFATGIAFQFIAYSLFWERLIGRIGFFEDKFGPGGTRTFYKIIGLIIFTFGLLNMTGNADFLQKMLVSLLVRE